MRKSLKLAFVSFKYPGKAIMQAFTHYNCSNFRVFCYKCKAWQHHSWTRCFTFLNLFACNDDLIWHQRRNFLPNINRQCLGIFEIAGWARNNVSKILERVFLYTKFSHHAVPHGSRSASAKSSVKQRLLLTLIVFLSWSLAFLYFLVLSSVLVVKVIMNIEIGEARWRWITFPWKSLTISFGR